MYNNHWPVWSGSFPSVNDIPWKKELKIWNGCGSCTLTYSEWKDEGASFFQKFESVILNSNIDEALSIKKMNLCYRMHNGNQYLHI